MMMKSIIDDDDDEDLGDNDGEKECDEVEDDY